MSQPLPDQSAMDPPKPRPLAPRRYVITERWITEIEVEVVAHSRAEAKRLAFSDDGIHPGIIDAAKTSALPIRDRDVRRA